MLGERKVSLPRIEERDTDIGSSAPARKFHHRPGTLGENPEAGHQQRYIPLKMGLQGTDCTFPQSCFNKALEEPRTRTPSRTAAHTDWEPTKPCSPHRWPWSQRLPNGSLTRWPRVGMVSFALSPGEAQVDECHSRPET